MSFLRLGPLWLTLTAAMRPTHHETGRDEVEGDQLCCCHKTIPPVEICVKGTQVFEKKDLSWPFMWFQDFFQGTFLGSHPKIMTNKQSLKNGFPPQDFEDASVEKPPWSNVSITVHETWEHGEDRLKETTWSKYFQLHYLGDLEPPKGLGLGNPKFMDYYYTEYKHEEKKGRNAKGADDYQLCTDRKNDCSCEFYEGQELKDCQKNLLDHCSKGACQQWMHMNKCTHTETDTTMKLMHKNSNMRIGTCFDKKQLKTRMMMAQCPEGYEKCDCNNQCWSGWLAV